MIGKIILERFKNFQQAELVCGPLTLLIGANAAGKSNIRDAFRFLHGIGRGYRLSEILGERYEGGTLQWKGIRGGVSEIAYQDADTFSLGIVVESSLENLLPYKYMIEVGALSSSRPRVVSESLYCLEQSLFETHSNTISSRNIKINILPGSARYKKVTLLLSADQPVLTQILDADEFASLSDDAGRDVRNGVQLVLKALRAMRFLDLNPEAMRTPAFVGQPLGDRGENLSSVLFEICEEPARKRALTEWLRVLTPMDARDFKFVKDPMGRVLVNLVEDSGHKTSAYNASDGTLRFLAVAAALLSDRAANFYFLEELENGIHPTRLHLLLDLIEKNVARGERQVIATTHSPQLLRLVNPETLAYTSLVYRLEGRSDGRIQQLQKLPSQAQDVLAKKDLAQLYESGWFENVVSFLSAEEEG